MKNGLLLINSKGNNYKLYFDNNVVIKQHVLKISNNKLSNKIY